MKHKILIVDDETAIQEALKMVFLREAYEVFVAGSAREALAIMSHEPMDVVISDEKMPGMSGSELIAIVHKKYPDTIRIILTGHAGFESAIRAIYEGEVYRFITKPCNSTDLAITVHKAIQHKELLKESLYLQEVVIQQSAILQEIIEQHSTIMDDTTKEMVEQNSTIIDDITQVKRDAAGGSGTLGKYFDEKLVKLQKMWEFFTKARNF